MVGDQVEGKDIYEKFVNWCFSQGVSTVLLTIIVIGGGYMAYVMIPRHLETIQAGYERINERNAAATEKLALSHEKAVDRIINLLDREAPPKP